MVVEYLNTGGRQRGNFAGTLVSHPDAERALHLSEPAAHNSWNPNSDRLRKADSSYPQLVESILKRVKAQTRRFQTGIPQIKPTFLDIAPSGIPSNIIPHSKGVKCGLIRSNSPFSYSNHRPAKPKIPKPLVYAQVSPLGTSFATP